MQYNIITYIKKQVRMTARKVSRIYLYDPFDYRFTFPSI